jgi:hypothetical protein
LAESPLDFLLFQPTPLLYSLSSISIRPYPLNYSPKNNPTHLQVSPT